MVNSQTYKQDEAVLSFVVSIIGIWRGGGGHGEHSVPAEALIQHLRQEWRPTC